MADEIHQAPRAPHETAAPTQPSVQPPASPHANFSRPTTSNGSTQNAALAAPAALAPSATTYPAPTTAQPAATEEPQTLNERLNNADRYWKFKGAFQAIAIITGLIGIGTIAWCTASISGRPYTYGYDGSWGLWPSLLTFACSIIWCVACIVVLVTRKRPVHPGLRVAIDLILWLGFITTALFAVVSFMELVQWGEYGDLGFTFGYSSSYGDYKLLSNNTWVWEQDEDYTSLSYLRPCEANSTSRDSYYSVYYDFKDCAEQDAYVNKLWHQKPHRESVQLTGLVCQFFGLVIHLVLFIWACVDTNRYNRSKVSKDAEKLAVSIVQTMISNGAVVPPPGQVHMRAWGQQPMGYYQLPPQGQAYPMTAMYPHPQQGMAGVPMHRAQGGAVAGLSTEKSEGPRYA